MSRDEFYDAIAATYDRTYASEADLTENRIIGSLLRGYYQDTMDVIDLGCGTGFTLELLDIDRLDYLGLDSSKGMVGQAQLNYPDHMFLDVDVEQATFFEPHLRRSADLVISLWAAHFQNLNRFVWTAHELLKPGGHAFFVVNGPGRDRFSARGNDPGTYRAVEVAELVIAFDQFRVRRIRGLRMVADPPRPRWWLPIEFKLLGNYALPTATHYIVEAQKRA